MSGVLAPVEIKLASAMGRSFLSDGKVLRDIAKELKKIVEGIELSFDETLLVRSVGQMNGLDCRADVLPTILTRRIVDHYFYVSRETYILESLISWLAPVLQSLLQDSNNDDTTEARILPLAWIIMSPVHHDKETSAELKNELCENDKVFKMKEATYS
ncbi:hypothetical protein CEK25_003651 [Fusarium fujikuroi]|nr:hypothetical protein CEK25_003651 [Fusarium fujikuroi]